jgi:hypothetical protein
MGFILCLKMDLSDGNEFHDINEDFDRIYGDEGIIISGTPNDVLQMWNQLQDEFKEDTLNIINLYSLIRIWFASIRGCSLPISIDSVTGVRFLPR